MARFFLLGEFFHVHENVLRGGIDGLIQKAESKLEEFLVDQEKVTFINSVIIVLKAVKVFIKRFSNLAKKLATDEVIHERKQELLEISEICDNISGNAPKSFKEALQLVYFTHLITGLEDGGFAISIGRLDQILYPYYNKDRKEGRISYDEVKFLIEFLIIQSEFIPHCLLPQLEITIL